MSKLISIVLLLHCINCANDTNPIEGRYIMISNEGPNTSYEEIDIRGHDVFFIIDGFHILRDTLSSQIIGSRLYTDYFTIEKFDNLNLVLISNDSIRRYFERISDSQEYLLGQDYYYRMFKYKANIIDHSDSLSIAQLKNDLFIFFSEMSEKENGKNPIKLEEDIELEPFDGRNIHLD